MHLPRCLDSILAQTYKEFECLLIDDGSNDNCPVICDDYSNRDKRINVYHKKNEGISKTRQFGLDHAKGSYIFFIDSDDWIEQNFFMDAMQKLTNTNTDILFMDFFKETVGGRMRGVSRRLSALDSETVIKLVLEGKLLSCLWNVIINRNSYIHNKVCFTEDINYGEDSLFIIELLLKNPKIAYLEEAYYHHTFNRNSFTRENKKARCIERIEFLKRLHILLERYGRNDLEKYNFFPLNDKYEMLTCGEFSKKEYQLLFKPVITFYYLKRTGLRKYILLVLAETNIYFIAKFAALFFQQVRRIVGY
jgi:glycosyltransferase involved in cell wall biosynthesis